MFPTLSYLVYYLTGICINLPINTFGLFMLLGFASAFFAFRSEYKRKKVPAANKLMDFLLFSCGCAGFLGAILFAKLENLHGIWQHPLSWLTSYNGLTYYGALIFGALTFLYINYRKGIPLRVAADIGSPGMMLAYGVGRLGCQLAGDGDWGIVAATKPAWLGWLPDWIWSSRFPHNSLHQGVFIPGCRDNYCMQLVSPVYPTSLYEAAICCLLFAVLWFFRRRIEIPGVMFYIYATLNGMERFLIEFIRITPRHVMLGLDLTQAQWIALLWMAIGVSGLIWTARIRSLSK